MQRSFALITLTILSVLAASTIGVTTASSSEYEINVANSIDTPTKTAEINGNDYEIDEIGAVEQGDVIEIDVTAPGWYDILLYNKDEQSEYNDHTDESTLRIGTEDDNLDTSNLDPGTYMLSLEENGERKAITPIVVQGYDISLEYPETVEKNSEIEVNATVESITELERPETVDVAIWDGSDVTERTLNHTGGTDYGRTLSLSEFETTTYDIYGAVIGDETVKEYSTVLAVEDGDSLTVTDTSDGNDGTDGSNNGIGNPPDSDDEKENTSDSPTENGSVDTPDNTNESSENTSIDDGPDEDDRFTNSNESENGTVDENDTNSTKDDNDSEGTVIQPNETEDSNESNSEDIDDGLGTPSAIPTLIALTVLLLAFVVHNRK